MLETFKGHFTWSHQSNSSGTLDTVNASGTFTVTVDLSQKSGTGMGSGTIDRVLSGFCSGKDTQSYTFTVDAGLDTLHGNVTLAFGLPTPATSSVAMTCPNSGGGNSAYSWYSVTPPMVSLQAAYGAKVEGTIGGANYEIVLA